MTTANVIPGESETALVRALLVLGALLALPVASACSFAGEVPPGPGAFVLTDLEDGTEWRIEVEERGLGGTCELSNAVGVAGGWIAWLEGGRLRVQDVHAASPDVVLAIDGHAQSLALFDRTTLLLRRDHALLVDLDSGAQRSVAIPPEGQRAVKKHLVAYQDGYGSGGRLSVLDARTGEALVDARAMPELGDRWWPRLVDDGWLLLHSESGMGPARHHLLDLVSGELSDLALPPHTSTVDLDGGMLYLAVWQRDGTSLDPPLLARMPVQGGAVEDIAAPVSQVASVTDGLALVPAFSVASYTPLRLLDGETRTPATPETPSSPPPTPAPTPRALVPGPAPLLALAAAALGAALGRR